MKGFKLTSYSFYCILAGMAIIKGVENSALMRNQIAGESEEDLLSLPQPNANTFTSSFWSSAVDNTEGLEKLNRYRTIMQGWKEKTGHAVMVNFEPEGDAETVASGFEKVIRPGGIVALTRWLSPSPSASPIGNRQKRSATSAKASVGNSPGESGKLDAKRAPTSIVNRQFRITPLASRPTSRFPAPFCELEIDSGIICPGLRRGLRLEQFHYDVDNNRCSHFVYNGCGGNANRFSTLWECTQSCVKESSATK